MSAASVVRVCFNVNGVTNMFVLCSKLGGWGRRTKEDEEKKAEQED